MGKLKLKKSAAPILSRLQRAENAFRQAVLEHTAWGQKMVVARTEFLEANAEDRAKLALKYPGDKLIQTKCNESTEELLAWYKKIGIVMWTGKRCAKCNIILNEIETNNENVTMCQACEDNPNACHETRTHVHDDTDGSIKIKGT